MNALHSSRWPALCALTFLFGCPSSSPGDDDDDSTPQEEEVVGFLFLGAPDDEGGIEPVPAGVEVVQVGTDRAATTSAEGLFRITPVGIDGFELFSDHASDDFLPVIAAMTWDQWGQSDVLELEHEDRRHTLSHYANEFEGAVYSPALGTLLVDLSGPEGDGPAPYGAEVTLDVASGGGYAFFDEGQGQATSVLPDGAQPELNFPRVEPGSVRVTVTPPEGMDACAGPETVTVRADTLSIVPFFCQ